jgi:hypothetical protein
LARFHRVLPFGSIAMSEFNVWICKICIMRPVSCWLLKLFRFFGNFFISLHDKIGDERKFQNKHKCPTYSTGLGFEDQSIEQTKLKVKRGGYSKYRRYELLWYS